MARLLLTASIGFLACQQGWAAGHCDDPDLDLCEDHDHSGGATSTSLELHMFEGEGCSTATDPPSKKVEMNKCTRIDAMTAKVTAKDATTVHFMFSQDEYPANCTDGEGIWGSGTALDCQNDGSECCNVEVNGAIEFSYKLMPSSSSSPTSKPTPVATPTPTTAESATPTPVATPTPNATSSPSPTPTPAAPESADTASGQAPVLMVAGTVGALFLNAA